MSALTRPQFDTLDAQPDVRYDARRKVHILKQDWSYTDAKHGVTICIEAGFPFDHASVPRIVWWLIAPFELSDAAPLLHDLGYRTRGEMCPERTYSRAEVDDLFRRVMAEAGVTRWRRVSAWAAVRAAGWRAWGS